MKIKRTDRYGRSVVEISKGDFNINRWWDLEMPLSIGNTSAVVIVRSIHALKIKHV